MHGRKPALWYLELASMLGACSAPCCCTAGIYRLSIYPESNQLINGKAKRLTKQYTLRVEKCKPCPECIFRIHRRNCSLIHPRASPQPAKPSPTTVSDKIPVPHALPVCTSRPPCAPAGLGDYLGRNVYNIATVFRSNVENMRCFRFPSRNPS